MKKLLSVLLILAMLATSLLSFASCGGKINEKKAQENPNEALQNALEANKTGFFADPTGAKAVIDKALNTEGSVGIAFESDTLLMEGMIKKIELSLVGKSAGTDSKSAISILANVNNKDLTANMYASKDGAIIKSQSLLGSNKALSFKYADLTPEKIKNSAFGKMTNLGQEGADETVNAMTQSIASLKSIMDKAFADNKDSDAKMNELFALLNLVVAEEKLDTADGKKADYITMTYTLSNATLKALINHLTKDMPLDDEQKANMEEAIAEMDKALELNVTAKVLIVKKTNTLEKIDINGTVTAKSEKEDGSYETTLTATIAGTVNATNVTLNANATSKGEDGADEPGSIAIVATYKEENNTNVYDLSVKATMGAATVEMVKATFTYAKSTGAYVLNANVALDGATPIPVEIVGNVTATETTATAEITSIKYNNEKLPAFKLTLKASTETKVPEFPTDAKDILTLTEAEIEEIMGELQTSDLFEIIGSSAIG